MELRLNMRGNLLGVVAGLLVAAGSVSAQNTPAKPVEKPAAPAAEAAADLMSGEEVMERYLKVTGGREAYEAVKSVTLTGTLEMGMGMTGKMKVYVLSSGKMRSDMTIEGVGEITSGTDGETVWSDNPMQGPRILEGSERDMTLQSSRIADEANWRERYKKVETVGVEMVNSKPAYKVEITPKEGSKRVAYYDKESGLLVKQTMKMESQMGEMPVEVFISDYKTVGGVMFPFKTRTLVMTQEMVATFDSVEVNTEIPAEKFELPDDIKELKAKKDEKAKKKAEKDAAPAPGATPEKK